MNIVFKNLEKSELAKNVIKNKIDEIVEKFPDLKIHKIKITLSMENSPQQAGPDLFGVRIQINGPQFNDLILEKKEISLYLTMARLTEALLERLNRTLDKVRVKTRKQARSVSIHNGLNEPHDNETQNTTNYK